MEGNRSAADGGLDPLEEVLCPPQPRVGQLANCVPIVWRGAAAFPVELVGVQTQRQRREPQLEDDLVGRRGDAVGTSQSGSGAAPVALPERQLGFPRRAHSRRVVVGAKEAPSAPRSVSAAANRPPRISRWSLAKLTGRAKYGSTPLASTLALTASASAQRPSATRASVSCPVVSAAYVRCSPRRSRSASPRWARSTASAGATGEPVGLDQVVPRRTDALGVVAAQGEVERFVQTAETVRRSRRGVPRSTRGRGGRSSSRRALRSVGQPPWRHGRAPGRRDSAVRAPPGRRHRTAG